MGFFRIYKEGWVSLPINAKAIYVVIAANSKNGVSNISKDKISKFSGIKDFDTIGKYIKILEEETWLTRKVKKTPKGFVYYYELVDRGKFEFMDKDFMSVDWDPNELALMASLITLRCNNIVDMPNLYKNTGFPKTSYYRYFKSLAGKNYITPASKTEPLKINRFIPQEDLTEENRTWVEEVLESEKDITDKKKHSTLYKQVKHLEDTNYEGIGSANAVIDSLKSGLGINNLPKDKRNKIEAAKHNKPNYYDSIY